MNEKRPKGWDWRAELGRRVVADELNRDLAFAQLFGAQDIQGRTLGLNILDLARGFLGVAPAAIQATATAARVQNLSEQARVTEERAEGAAIGGLFDVALAGFSSVATGGVPNLATVGTNISSFISGPAATQT